MAAGGSRGSVIAFLFFILLTEICFSGFILPSNFIRRNADLEWQWVNESLGESTNTRIDAMAGTMYDVVVLGPALEEKLRAGALPTERARRSKSLINPQKREQIWDYYEERINVVFDTLYWFFRRLSLFIIWFPLWLPAIIISVRTGFLERDVKKSGFAHTSPTIQHHAFKAIGGAVFILLASFLLPLALPPVAVPVLYGVVVLLIGIACSNMQKRI